MLTGKEIAQNSYSEKKVISQNSFIIYLFIYLCF